MESQVKECVKLTQPVVCKIPATLKTAIAIKATWLVNLRQEIALSDLQGKHPLELAGWIDKFNPFLFLYKPSL